MLGAPNTQRLPLTLAQVSQVFKCSSLGEVSGHSPISSMSSMSSMSRHRSMEHDQRGSEDRPHHRATLQPRLGRIIAVGGAARSMGHDQRRSEDRPVFKPSTPERRTPQHIPSHQLHRACAVLSTVLSCIFLSLSFVHLERRVDPVACGDVCAVVSSSSVVLSCLALSSVLFYCVVWCDEARWIPRHGFSQPPITWKPITQGRRRPLDGT